MSNASSREGLLGREREIMRILALLVQKGPEFIIVGGYAISTHKKRFSIDLDVIVQEKDVEEFGKILEKEGYAMRYEKKISLLYGENFKRYLKKMKNLPVCVDLLINGLVSRTTDATWSFTYVKKNSTEGVLNGLQFSIPRKELLIAMKLHSGRLSDIRDVVALMPCDKEELKKHLFNGDAEKLKVSIRKQAAFLDKPQFDDSFKGIFGIQAYQEENVEAARALMNELLKGKTLAVE